MKAFCVEMSYLEYLQFHNKIKQSFRVRKQRGKQNERMHKLCRLSLFTRPQMIHICRCGKLILFSYHHQL